MVGRLRLALFLTKNLNCVGSQKRLWRALQLVFNWGHFVTSAIHCYLLFLFSYWARRPRPEDLHHSHHEHRLLFHSHFSRRSCLLRQDLVATYPRHDYSFPRLLRILVVRISSEIKFEKLRFVRDESHSCCASLWWRSPFGIALSGPSFLPLKRDGKELVIWSMHLCPLISVERLIWMIDKLLKGKSFCSDRIFVHFKWLYLFFLEFL